jgi:plastocyanin
VRAAVALLVLALLGALTAFALPHPGGASNPKRIGTVGPGYTITLTDADGNSVTSLPAGTYDIEVHDNAAIHNFHLFGPASVDESTDVAGTGQVTWTVTLVAGTYTYQCDPHADLGMRATFTVAPFGTTSTATTGTSTASTGTTTQTTTTVPPTTSAPTTTAARPPRKAPRCVVPRVVGRPLARARRMLVRAHCRTGKISRRFSHKVRGRVLSQRPRTGVRRPVGARVDLVVSRGRRR